jgi:hypothetical protein
MSNPRPISESSQVAYERGVLLGRLWVNPICTYGIDPAQMEDFQKGLRDGFRMAMATGGVIRPVYPQKTSKSGT